MGLGALESSGQTTDSHLVAGENMVNGVDGARAQQRGPAAARQEVDGTGDARHPGRINGKEWKKTKGRKKQRKRDGGKEEAGIITLPKILGRLSHRANHGAGIADYQGEAVCLDRRDIISSFILTDTIMLRCFWSNMPDIPKVSPMDIEGIRLDPHSKGTLVLHTT